MTDAMVLGAGRDAMMLTLYLSAPILVVGLVVGLIIAVFQAATQVNEMTLSYIPKILAVFAVVAVLGPWMLSTIVTYTTNLLSRLPDLAR